LQLTVRWAALDITPRSGERCVGGLAVQTHWRTGARAEGCDAARAAPAKHTCGLKQRHALLISHRLQAGS